jgi:hypothetical protein
MLRELLALLSEGNTLSQYDLAERLHTTPEAIAARLDLEGMVHTPELAPVSPSVCVKRFVSESDRGMNHAIKSNSLPNEDTSELAPRFFIFFTVQAICGTLAR